MKVNVIAMEGFDALHGEGMGAASIAEAPVCVVDVLRPINADANDEAIAMEAVAPGVVEPLLRPAIWVIDCTQVFSASIAANFRC